LGLLRRADTAPLCYAFFTGLVLFSLREPWHRIRSVTPACWSAALAACVIVAWAVTLDHARTEPAPWMLLYGGALAIAVMLLPGISGSLMLLVLGQYTTIAGAVHAPDFMRLGIFGAGIVLGLLLFIPFLKRLLRTHHDVTMAALTGLMAGSLVALWPWKSHYDLKDHAQGQMTNVAIGANWPLVLLFAALGAGAVWGLRVLERRIDRSA
jgi:putative membrane protein